MKKGKKRSAVLLTTLMLTSGLYVTPAGFTVPVEAAVKNVVNPSSMAFDQKVIARVNADQIFEDLRYLADTIGPRVAGTEGEQKAADFIREKLQSYGYQVETQEFSIPNMGVGHLHTSDGKEVAVTIPSGSAATNSEGITSFLYDAGLGKLEDFTDEAKGKIALISRGEITFRAKVDNAVAAGATAVLIYDNGTQLTPLNPSLGGNVSIPVAGLTKASGEALLRDVVEQNKTVSFEVTLLENRKSQNIIATRTPNKGENHDIVHVSAHFDSVPFAPGASDNASGTAVALEIAKVLKSYPIDKEVRFVFVGAEEIGLLGSKYYVEQLSEDEVSRSIANFNMDMVGTSWENATAIYMNTLDGQANIVTETAIATAERIGTPSELVLYQRGASDHVSFHDAGIPAVNFIRREPGTASLEPYYHTPLDTTQHISSERLKEAGDLVGASVYQLIKK
ncbi:M20/M25/M40 family metallo-hydrolase [Bacillus sp. 31A1R]|uniref:M20/M25/M40 family metallo-hydrolase n=1 Tax=Robertmurraya mangrovi TaxID=3098077 RepID=A0ABU5J3S0_9BACI|nr:M20/M25/M40 family metallo-hydrolase [Bacillus sp. 31A1R]MDZ5474081.1 M20/M25/M40 family metallo-hydrolase [Bacillus sp. 31A1R]